MQNKNIMVMPPIYRFSLPDCPQESKWGWHRATELVEAINNILKLEGKEPMSPEQINEKYPFIRLNKKRPHPAVWEPKHVKSPVVCLDRSYGGTSVGETKWLATLVDGDFFLPAKLGMSLLDAVKHPILCLVKKAFAD